MKKLLICASMIGVAAGVAYWVYKKGKANKTATASSGASTANFGPKPQEAKKPQEATASDYMNQTKSECVQGVYERHTAVGKVLEEAYGNIMENFVENYPIEKAEGSKENDNKTIIESEDVSVIKELDSISDELDDLLN